MKKILLIPLLFVINITYSQLLCKPVHITSPSTNLNIDQWSYIAITKGLNNDGNFYKDGQLIYSGAWQNLVYTWSKIELGSVYFTSYSISKSENDGTSILSTYVISVIDGKSFTEIKFNIISDLSPVPYKSL